MAKDSIFRGTGHTHAPRGKRVRVTLHNGDTFVAKFRENESGYITFYDHDKVKAQTVYKLSIWPKAVHNDTDT